jgi:hypothetical protein
MTLRRSGLITFVACVLALIVSSGCLPFPLGDPAQSKIDSKLVGFWLNDSADDRDLIAIYPFDEHTYVVQDQKLHMDDNKWTPRDTPMLFKGWLTEVKGHRFLCMEPLFQKIVPQDHNFYPAMQLETVDSGIKVRLVNADFDPIKSAKNAADELAVVTREIDNPKLYDESQTSFHRLDPEKDKDTISLIVKF